MQKGFTIVELLVAITVMAVSIVAVYGLIPASIKISVTNTNKYIATQLAREGIEIVRNIRDSNWLEQMESSTALWDEGLTNCVLGCEVNYTTPSIQDPVLPAYGVGRYLRIDANGFYNYTVGTVTKFKRKVAITVTGDGLRTIVTVTWSSEYPDVVIEEIFYDWR
ncbi:MAG: type II secretion system protein [Parcubacteria group bacterium]|nr:type II secretion system protein [Parcubacteria group bacterium]